MSGPGNLVDLYRSHHSGDRGDDEQQKYQKERDLGDADRRHRDAAKSK
jgi:hypothetical protein